MTPIDLGIIVCLLFVAAYTIASIGLACGALIGWVKRKRANRSDRGAEDHG